MWRKFASNTLKEAAFMAARNFGMRDNIKPKLVAWRWVRMLWPLIFFLPLGILSGKLCWISVVDPAYHGLIWLHERLPIIVLVLAAISVCIAAYRFMRLQDSLRLLLSLSVAPPVALERIFLANQHSKDHTVQLKYIDIGNRFCFTIFDGPSIVVSRGFVENLSAQDLHLVAMHEISHVKRRDPWRAIGWHLFFAGLILPGFEAVETVLHLRRERVVDAGVVSETHDENRYNELLERCSVRRDRAYGSICTGGVAMNEPVGEMASSSPEYLWDRAFPAMVSAALLLLVFLSHDFFIKSLPYLQTHHC